MLYISRNGEVIKTSQGLENALNVYDEWNAGEKEFEINTSGSTGQPKLIKLSRAAIQASIQMTQEKFDIKSTDSFLCNLNTEFIGGKMMVLRAAEIGCEMIILQPTSNPFETLGTHREFLENNWNKNIFSFVPMQLKNVLSNESNIKLLKTAKVILVGGARVSKGIQDKIQQYNLPAFETYGMTETISHIAVRDIRKNEDYFTILRGVKIETDPDQCLRIKSPSTLNKWITTNDVIELLSENTFKLKGRRDNIINSGGIKIQLEEIEQLIEKSYPIHQSYFLFGKEDDLLGEKLVLYVEGQNIDFEKLKMNLPKHKKPKEVIYLQSFTRTPSGKIDKLRTVASTK